jgi:hypothetical protein
MRFRLVELGADKLGAMLFEHHAKDYGAAHYYKGGFQALKEAAYSLFGIDSADFCAQCMFEVTCRRLDGLPGMQADDDPVGEARSTNNISVSTT